MLFRFLAGLFFCIALVWVPTVRATDLIVVLSDNGGVYGEFASTLQQHLESSTWRVRWIGTVDNLDAAPRADLIVSVGAEATKVSARRTSAPLIAALLPRQAWERVSVDVARPRGSITAIYLDQPVGRLMSFVRYLLPDKRRVGLLLGSETRALAPLARQAAASNSQALEIEEMEGGENPVLPLNQLLSRSDALLALPDSSIYRRENIRAILLTTYRFQKPLIGFSQAMVTAGALAAIYSTPGQAARQTADLIQALPATPGSLPPAQAPATFAISINSHVAQSLGLQLPDEATLRRQLAGEREIR